MNLAQLGQLFEAAAFSGDQRQVEEAMQLLKHAHNTLGFLITMISPHISNALLNGKFAKEEIRWAYLCRINALFGTASTLYVSSLLFLACRVNLHRFCLISGLYDVTYIPEI